MEEVFYVKSENGQDVFFLEIEELEAKNSPQLSPHYPIPILE